MKTARFGRYAVVLVLMAWSTACFADVTNGLIAHWTFDENRGDQVADSVGKHTGIAHGVKAAQDGICGKSALFSNRDDSVVKLRDRLQLSDTNQVTLAAVIRVRSFNSPDLKNRANSRNGILGSDDSNLIFGLTDRGLPLLVWDASDNKYQTAVADRECAVPIGQWCQVVATRDGRVVKLYVNGRLRTVQDVGSDGNFVPFNQCVIGRVNGSPSRDFDGWIDDLRVYNRALSPEEVWALAKGCGLAGKSLARVIGSQGLERIRYNHPGLVVDLGVGLWAQPLPMDYDGDGDIDLVISCRDVPFNGLYLFENPGGGKMPIFKQAVRIAQGLGNVQVSYVGGQPHVLQPGIEYLDFRNHGVTIPHALPVDQNIHAGGRVRANQWKYADYDGDGKVDLIVGIGDWSDYGWDNAFNEKGQWTRGPLHGYVYVVRNRGTSDQPEYDKPMKILAEKKPVDVFGMPSPNLADFDGDGDLDLLCGDFVDTFTYFENVGTRAKPRYRAGRKLTLGGELLRVDLCMHVDVALDWDKDGDVDLIVGQEDGRVMLIEHTGRVVDGLPRFAAPKFFKQQAEYVKFGALVTPVSVDWDGDGDEDLICGNTAGYIGFIENLDGGCPPKWAEPVLLKAAGQTLRILAGYNGSIQGPCEAKWGYTTLSVADWDHDGLLDLVVNSIWGKIVWYRNVGTKKQPKLAAVQPIEVQWTGKPPKPAWNWWNPKGNQLATQWRTTPVAIDWDCDGLTDLVMLDHEGYLAWFQRKRVGGQLRLLPGKRVFGTKADKPLQLSAKKAGGSGRRKLCFADWDGDGQIDLLANSRNVDFMRAIGQREEKYLLDNRGLMDTRRLAGHTTSPTVTDWNHDGVPDLIVGAEDGHLYYLRNPRSDAAKR